MAQPTQEVIEVSKPDEQSTNSTEDQPKDADQQQTPADDQPPAEEPKADEKPAEKEEEKDADKEGGDELPEWAREKLTEANAEAANYRTKLRDAEKAIKDFEGYISPDDHQASVTTATRDLLIENVALKHKLPAKLQSRLVGSTREELEADAKELAAEFGIEHEELHLEGGLRPRSRRNSSKGMSPGELANAHGPRAKRR